MYRILMTLVAPMKLPSLVSYPTFSSFQSNRYLESEWSKEMPKISVSSNLVDIA